MPGKITIAAWAVLLLLGDVDGWAAPCNVILCMSDDQGWGDTGYNGHPHLQTPHLDQMSREGITFTRFYAAAAMCSPTRGSCYTGRHPYRYGITFAMKGRLEPTELPITTVLKRHGYITGHFGKWHLGTLTNRLGDQRRWGAFAADPQRYYGPPWERDVDVCFVTESKVPTWDPLIDPGPIRKPSLPAGTDLSTPFGNDYFVGPGRTETENTRGDDSRVIMDRALPFIQQAVAADRPFLAVIWFHTPHSPVVGGERYRQLYADYPVDTQHYYACLSAMDEQLGRLRTELQRLGVERNTMLWFCSDNGPARQGSPRHVGRTKGLSGFKLSINEGGIRVPGLLVWPERVTGPRRIDAPCVTTDYFPTILDALGITLPSDRVYDGISLLPLIDGDVTRRDSAIGFLNREGREAAWMEDRFKLIEKSGSLALYDIPADPAERRNLAATHTAEVQRMQTALLSWQESVRRDLHQHAPP